MATALGAVAAASLAWMGHGAASEGPFAEVHLASDMLHALAAAVWIGALVCFLLLLLVEAEGPGQLRALHISLRRFAGIGSAAVAALILTGLVNGWALVGPDEVYGLWSSPYGRLLIAKLMLFVAMLALAAFNRFRFTPALERAPGRTIGALRRSVATEAAAGLAILGLAAWLGTLAPPGG